MAQTLNEAVYVIGRVVDMEAGPDAPRKTQRFVQGGSTVVAGSNSDAETIQIEPYVMGVQALHDETDKVYLGGRPQDGDAGHVV